MGFGTITESRPVSSGGVNVGQARPAFVMARGVSSAASESSTRPARRLENPLPIAEGLQRARIVGEANDILSGIQADSDEILNGRSREDWEANEEMSPAELEMAWKDKDGIFQAPVKSLKGESAGNAATVWEDEMRRRVAKRLDGKPEWLKEYVLGNAERILADTHADLQRWGMSEMCAGGVARAEGSHSQLAASKSASEVSASVSARTVRDNNARAYGSRLDGSARSDYGWKGPQTYQVEGAARILTEFGQLVTLADGKRMEIDMITPDTTDEEMDRIIDYVARRDKGEELEPFSDYAEDIFRKAVKFAEKQLENGGSIWGPDSARVAAKNDAGKISRWLIENKERMIRDLMIQSYGRMSRPEAERIAAQTYDRAAIGMVTDIAESRDYDRAHDYIDALLGVGANRDDVRQYHNAVKAIERKHIAEDTAALNDRYDQIEASFGDVVNPDDAETVIRGWSRDPELKRLNPKRARGYAEWASKIEEARKNYEKQEAKRRKEEEEIASEFESEFAAAVAAVPDDREADEWERQSAIRGTELKAKKLEQAEKTAEAERKAKVGSIENDVMLYRAIAATDENRVPMEVPEETLKASGCRTRGEYLQYLQRKIWKDLSVAAAGGQIERAKYETLAADMNKIMSAESVYAMKGFLTRLGCDVFDLLDSNGLPSKSTASNEYVLRYGGQNKRESKFTGDQLRIMCGRLLEAIGRNPKQYNSEVALRELGDSILTDEIADGMLDGFAEEAAKLLDTINSVSVLPRDIRDSAKKEVSYKYRKRGETSKRESDEINNSAMWNAFVTDFD